jgi:hypothetical protein
MKLPTRFGCLQDKGNNKIGLIKVPAAFVPCRHHPDIESPIRIGVAIDLLAAEERRNALQQRLLFVQGSRVEFCRILG